MILSPVLVYRYPEVNTRSILQHKTLDCFIIIRAPFTPQSSVTVPEHCYEFTHYAFWVHFIGLPRARITEDAIRLIASRLGEVVEIKIEVRSNNSRKSGKAKVLLNLSNPLKTGSVINCETKSGG